MANGLRPVYLEAVDAFRRKYVEHMLAAHQGNVTQAAVAMGIGRANLYAIMKRIGALGAERKGGK